MPPRFETRRVRGAGGVSLAVHRLGGEGPPVLALHATGFHGRCWWPLAESLLVHRTVWALDQRGHGESEPDPGRRYSDWSVFAADALAAVDTLGGDSWTAVGHSLGGGVALLAEASRPGTFAALACYEPVVVPPSGFSQPNPLAMLARKRRPTFESKRAALENYRSKPPFRAFDPVALEMYVEHGLVERPDGTVALACDREDEAAIFEGAATNPAWERLPEVRAPALILAGGSGEDPVAAVAPSVARRLPRGGLRRFDALDHFGPMTAPAEVGEVMARAVAAGTA